MRLTIMLSTIAAFVAIQCFEGCDRDDLRLMFADHVTTPHRLVLQRN